MGHYIANYVFAKPLVDSWVNQEKPNTSYRFFAEDDLEALKIADIKLKEISRRVINVYLDSLIEIREIPLDFKED